MYTHSNDKVGVGAAVLVVAAAGLAVRAAKGDR